MHVWILIVACVGLFLYLFLSVIFVAKTNFWYHDYYLDEDINYPPRRPSWVPKDAFLIDLHCHSTASDGLLTPEQLIKWHVSNGYDGMVVSDHNTMDAVNECIEIAKKIAPDFLVIPGVEFTSMRVHLNLIGVKSLMPIPNLLWTTKNTIKATIKHAHDEGGVVMFNHRDWYPINPLKKLTRAWWLEQGIDGWEVFNGFNFIDKEALDFIDQNKDKRIMFAGAGTDIHDPAKHYLAYTEVITNDRTVDGVIRALKEGKTRVHFNLKQGHPRSRPEHGKIKRSKEKEKFIKKWIGIYWPGAAILSGTHRTGLYIFMILTLLTAAILSFI
ncbi:MAG: PHP domain-containing protein [Promethearchaeota archaeon]